MTRSRESRREAAKAREKSSSSRFLLPVVGAGVVIVAAIGAILLTGGSGTGGGSTPLPSFSSGGAVSSADPTVTGQSLPLFDQSVGDPAVGQVIPTVQGSDFNGQSVSIDLDGRPKVLLFLAHWCSHCQAEVPAVQDWLDAGRGPTDVDLISVATSNDPGAPNYPPDAWLEREGWTVPVIVDSNGSVAPAYGLSAFPFWVFVGADGQVTGRLTGELPIADLETIIASLPR
ncbi:MAG: TlpA family protein disulfide reductase [Chloroflexota bacterium]|jgi:cytochrome c biogenesis protein CcmG/thiol:disulfide interchange protein DsbE|nr:TlpA family protein disulfide reductase [Chloroflexota bacterium]